MFKYALCVAIGFLLSFCSMQPRINVKCAVHKGRSYPIYYFYNYSKCQDILDSIKEGK